MKKRTDEQKIEFLGGELQFCGNKMSISVGDFNRIEELLKEGESKRFVEMDDGSIINLAFVSVMRKKYSEIK